MREKFQGFLVVLISITAYSYSAIWRGKLYYTDSIVFGTEQRPFVYRLLMPLLARLVVFITGWQTDTAVIIVMIISAVGLFYAIRFLLSAFKSHNTATDVIAFICTLASILLVIKDIKIYDLASALFFTVCLSLLARGNLQPYFIIFPLVTLNKETSFLLIVFFAIYFREKVSPRYFWFAILYQCVTYIIVKVLLLVAFAENSGAPAFFRPAEVVTEYLENPFLSLMLLAGLILFLLMIFYSWNQKPSFLRTAFVVLFPAFLLLHFLMGIAFEIRVFVEIFPVMALMAFPVRFGSET